MSFRKFTGVVRMTSQAREPVPSLRRVYKSLTRIALLLFFITLSFHHFPKNRWHNFFMWPACLFPKSSHITYHGLPPTSSKKHNSLGQCLRLPSKRSHSIPMAVALLFKTTVQIHHVGEQGSRNFRKVRKENTTATYLCIPALVSSFTLLPSLLALVCVYKISGILCYGLLHHTFIPELPKRTLSRIMFCLSSKTLTFAIISGKTVGFLRYRNRRWL